MRITTSLAVLGVLAGTGAFAQDTPSPALLVLHKGENAMAIVDPANGEWWAGCPSGKTPTSWPSRRMENSPSRAITAAIVSVAVIRFRLSTSRRGKNGTALS